MATLNTLSASNINGIEWQNILRSRLMAKQAESEAYREIVDQCQSSLPPLGKSR